MKYFCYFCKNELIDMKHYFSLNIKGRLVEFFEPVVMGIINITPDSFYCDSRNSNVEQAVATASKMLADGAAILDIGGCSTRPDSTPASEDEELARVIPVVSAIRKQFPNAIISIDTFRGKVAREAIKSGADIINDISAGNFDCDILLASAELKAPYILTHPASSSLNADTNLDHTTSTVLLDLQKMVRKLRLQGVCDIIIDPGFGFGKTLEQNYRLMTDLDAFKSLDCPILVGISRKRMINNLLEVTAQSDDSLIGTTTLNSFALSHGANILRVHDVKAAVNTIKIISKLSN